MQKHRAINTESRPAAPGAKVTQAEPYIEPVYSYESLTPEELRDPARIQRSGFYDQFRGAAVIGEGGDQDEILHYDFDVAHLSDFNVVWPSATLWTFEDVPAYTDEKGVIHPARKKRHLKPHIGGQHAEVTLSVWHQQDVYLQRHNYLEMSDVVEEAERKSVMFEMLLGRVRKLAREMAERDTLANREQLERQETDLEAEELEALVEQLQGTGRRRPALPPGAEGT